MDVINFYLFIVSFNQFQIIQIINKNAISITYKAILKKNKKIYFLLRYSKNLILSYKLEKKIFNEKKILIKLYNNFIVNFYCSFQDNNYLYIVKEYYNGGTLQYHIKKNEYKFSEDQIKFFCINSILILEYLESKNVFHRYINPNNFILDEKGYFHLDNFFHALINSKETKYDIVFCLKENENKYIAPESNLKKYFLNSDYYSLGIIIYELFLGPYQKDKYHFQLKNSSCISIEGKNFIEKIIDKNYDSRFKNIKEIKKDKWLNNVDWFYYNNHIQISPWFNIISKYNNYDNIELNENDEFYIDMRNNQKNSFFNDQKNKYYIFKNYTHFIIPIDNKINQKIYIPNKRKSNKSIHKNRSMNIINKNYDISLINNSKNEIGSYTNIHNCYFNNLGLINLSDIKDKKRNKKANLYKLNSLDLNKKSSFFESYNNYNNNYNINNNNDKNNNNNTNFNNNNNHNNNTNYNNNNNNNNTNYNNNNYNNDNNNNFYHYINNNKKRLYKRSISTNNYYNKNIPNYFNENNKINYIKLPIIKLNDKNNK